MTESPTPAEVLCCYSHADETWLRKLETHLSLLKRQGLISLWHDRLITPGIDWAQTIDTHLETVSVILLLISADFLASDYCYGVEMKRALERHEAGGAWVIPILVRSADWKNAPFAHLQALPSDAKPIASWRSQDRALADVASGVRRVIEDLPLLAASAPRTVLPKIWNIPYPRNPFFLGRDAALLQMRQNLQVGQSTAFSQPQAISGLGGIGKTQLALEYAYRYHQDYQAVLWANAESTEALISSYIALATVLRLPEREAREQEDIVQAVKTWLQAHRGWLLILDNADEPDVLIPFLPPQVGGHVLVTTRASDLSDLGLGFGHTLAVETFPNDQGALFLLQRAALEDASSQDRNVALHIAHELGGLPLALDQAGAYLKVTGCGFASYLQIYRQSRAQLLKKRHGKVHPQAVATTWDLSFQRVASRNPAAADLLRLCAFLAPDAIPEEILTEGAAELGPVLAPIAVDLLLLNEAIAALCAYSLLTRDAQAQTLTVHRLVQAVLLDTLPFEIRQQWMQYAVQAVNADFSHIEFENWPTLERLLPHALICATWIEQASLATPAASRLLHQAGYYLMERGRYREAEPLMKRALTIRERELGATHPHTATSLNNLGLLYWKQGKYREAEPLHQRALAIREQQLGASCPATATSLGNLGLLYRKQGKYREAEPLMKRALAIYERELGTSHPDTATSLGKLADLYYTQGKYGEAEPLYQRALRIREQQLGPEHPETAEIIHNLAQLLEAQDNNEEARAWYAHALAVREQALGVHHPSTTETRQRLIALLHAMGQHEEAAQLEATQSEP